MSDLTLLASGRVRLALRSLRIETASWAYANSGTRFKGFPQEG